MNLKHSDLEAFSLFVGSVVTVTDADKITAEIEIGGESQLLVTTKQPSRLKTFKSAKHAINYFNRCGYPTVLVLNEGQ